MHPKMIETICAAVLIAGIGLTSQAHARSDPNAAAQPETHRVLIEPATPVPVMLADYLAGTRK